MPSFEGQTAVVTGASSGIGRAIALALARRAAGVFLLGRDRHRLEKVASEAREATSRVFLHAADLTSADEIRRLAPALEEAAGGVGVLVHSMGRFAAGPSDSLPVAELDALYRVNLRAPFLLTRTLLPMLSASAGQIVFVNSSIVRGARAGVGAYAATKFGLQAQADSLRDEVNPLGIRVLSVYPGRTATPMQAAIFAAEGRPYEPQRLLQPEDVAEIVVAALLLPRTAEVTDIHIRPLNKV